MAIYKTKNIGYKCRWHGMKFVHKRMVYNTSRFIGIEMRLKFKLTLKYFFLGVIAAISIFGFLSYSLLDRTNQFPFILVSSEPLPKLDIVPTPTLISLSKFIIEQRNGEPDELRGIYVDNLLADPVIMQPKGQPGWVSSKDGVVTLFSLAQDFGSLGLIAHYEKAGGSFNKISTKDHIHIVFGSGKVDTYRVDEIRCYQAENYKDPFTRFIPLLQPDVLLNQQELFSQIYGVKDRLILQTCLPWGDNYKWGRLFIIASPVDEFIP